MLRQRLADLYEIAALRAEGVELAYLLTAPVGTSGDLVLTTAIDSELQAYAADEGIFLLDADGNGLYISGATAIDANGNSIAVAVQSSISNQQSSMSLVIPGDWLANAAYPILIDPYVMRWQTNSSDRTPAIAYDTANNRALIAYLSGNKLYARLVNTENGTTIHEAQLGALPLDFLAPWVGSPAVIFDSQQNEYLVVCGRTWTVTYWRVDADGYQVGNVYKNVGYGLNPSSSIEAVDIASAGDDAKLVVWSDSGVVRARRISLDGTWQDGLISIVVANGRNAAAAYDATLEAYMVTWQQSGEIRARTVWPDGSMGEPFPVSDDPGAEADPDVAYSALTGQTLVVWSSDEGGGRRAIQSRRLAGGAPASPTFMVSQPSDVDQFPRAAANENSNWVVTWQRTDPDSTPPNDDVWLSPVPGDASGDLTGSNKALRESTSANETHPSVALRYDFVPMVALVETISGASAIVLVIDTAEPQGNFDWHYEYDDLGQMTFACSDWHSGDCQGDQWQYSYDGAGNQLLFDHWDKETRQTITTQYIINGANQVECIDDASGDGICDDSELLWEYDPYGNVLYDGVTHYEYNTAGRLSRVVFGGSDTTYVYNGDGERVSQTSNIDGTTTYLLDVAASTVLAETLSGRTIHYLNGLNPVSQSDGTATAYFQYDGAGSVRQLANSSGSVQHTQTFDPYGNLYQEAGAGSSTYGFGGGSHDTNGLVYFEGKYYNPTQGPILRQLSNVGRSIFSTVGLGGTWDAWASPAFVSGHTYEQMQAIEVRETAPMAGWWVTLAMRQHQIMNYDAYYEPYGDAGKYLYLQDMLAQSGQVFDASMMFFGEVTMWASLTNEAVLLSQTSGFYLNADELALAGMSSDDVVQLAKLQERAAAGGYTAGINTIEWGKSKAEVEAIRQALLARNDIGGVQQALRNRGIYTDRKLLELVKRYNFDSPGIEFELKNYQAWTRLASGEGRVRDAAYMIHETAEVEELLRIQQRTGFDVFGRTFGNLSKFQQRQWRSEFLDIHYAQAHAKALEAEYDFVAQQLFQVTNGRVRVGRNVAALADLDPLRMKDVRRYMLADGIPLQNHYNFQMWAQRGRDMVSLGQGAQRRLGLQGSSIALSDLIAALKLMPIGY